MTNWEGRAVTDTAGINSLKRQFLRFIISGTEREALSYDRSKLHFTGNANVEMLAVAVKCPRMAAGWNK